MIIFFSADEMGGSCNRTSYMDALKKFWYITSREAKHAWMSPACMQDMMKCSRGEGEDEVSEDELLERTSRIMGVNNKFYVMVSESLTDPAMYFGVGD